MSHTELHIGKLREVKLIKNQTIEDFYKSKLKEKNITELKSYYDTWKEAFRDEFDEKYFIVNDKIFEAFEHEKKENDDDIYDIKQNTDGTYSFIMQFYNGGTCLYECIEGKLEEILKNKINEKI